jgi:hypothetical protein
MEMEIPVLSFADLYGGKICAALDSQHPRDLFDIRLLSEAGGLNEEISQAVKAISRLLLTKLLRFEQDKDDP